LPAAALSDAESFFGVFVLVAAVPGSAWTGVVAAGVGSLLSLLAGALELELEDRESFL
jgi:hypothetical protein